jgi:protein involved in polysaccharide export with SLBB domain
MERGVGGLALLAAGLILGGCGTPSSTDSRINSGFTPEKPAEFREVLRVGDPVNVRFSGVLSPPKDHDERIKEDGCITLAWVGRVKAEGLTVGELQEAIKKSYSTLYRDMTVTVTSENRFFYIGGEVRVPTRLAYATKITVCGAINAAGGFTDFANKTNVKLTRANGEIHIINWKKAQKKPELDLQVYPGDKIEVPRRIM